MKFACEQCKTKYSIADERVRGKVLKIRCKHCSHIITVREEAPPQGREKGVLERAMEQALRVPPAASFQGSDATIVGTPEALLGSRGLPPQMDPEEWHLSVDGVAAGPLRLEALAQRVIVERAAGDQELFVWRDGFDDWQPPKDVAEVRAAVERLRPGLPRNFWGGAPVSLQEDQPRHEVRSTHPVERVESFEFTDTPPTIAVPRKAPVAPKEPPRPADSKIGATRPTSSRSQQGTEPQKRTEAKGEKRPEPRPPLAELPELPPAPVQAPPPEPIESLNEALASLAAHATSSEAREEPAPADSEFNFNIAEPSQMIDLAALAESVRPPSLDPDSPIVLPGLDQPPPPAELASPVMIVAGPAPAAPSRSLKVILAVALAACVLLIATVAYLLTRQPGGKQQVADRRDDGKAVTDRPVLVKDDGPVGGPVAPADAAAKKSGGAVKRPMKLPAAANGKTQLDGNAATLAKLYQEGGDKTPALPQSSQGAGSQGGGVSTAELQDVMRRNQKSLSACYDRFLKHDESLRRARIDVQVRVGLSGSVTFVSIAGPLSSTELGTCMQQTIRRWHFPPSDSDYETQFPLILTAN